MFIYLLTYLNSARFSFSILLHFVNIKNLNLRPRQDRGSTCTAEIRSMQYLEDYGELHAAEGIRDGGGRKLSRRMCQAELALR